jgi:hypothetical protein
MPEVGPTLYAPASGVPGLWTLAHPAGGRDPKRVTAATTDLYRVRKGLVDNNVFIGNSYIRTFNATGIVFANNPFMDNGRIKIEGEVKEGNSRTSSPTSTTRRRTRRCR